MTECAASLARQFAVEVVQTLRAAGHVAYWAGGCVRDHLLGTPPKDFDVATSARPEQVRQIFGKRRTLAIGQAFGVIAVLGRGEQGQIEVATFRQDLAYHDGRHPEGVVFSSPEQDALRRDFTINGLFYDPLTDEVLDFVGGRDDLARRVIRAIGDADLRIGEDQLRMLRAVRFATTLGFAVAPATLAAIQSQAHRLANVSAERIAAEMQRLLSHRERARGLELLRQSDLLAEVLPELQHLPSDPAAWNRMQTVLSALPENRFPLAVAGLLTFQDQSWSGPKLSVRWKLSNAQSERIEWLLANRDALAGAGSKSWPQLQRVLIAPGAEDLLALTEAQIAVGAATADDCEFCRERLAWPRETLDPPPLLSGDDLIAIGLRPGKQFALLLDQVRDAQLLGELHSPGEALAWVRRKSQDGPA